MEQTRCRRQDYFTHRRPSFIRDRFLSERWRRRAWRAIYPGDSCGSTEGRSSARNLNPAQAALDAAAG